MTIRFFLQAEKNFDGNFRVKEWFAFDGRNEDGSKKFLSGHVDDSIRAKHSAEYERFRAFVDCNDEMLYAAAREAYPEPLMVDMSPKVEVLPEVLEEKKPIRRSKK